MSSGSIFAPRMFDGTQFHENMTVCFENGQIISLENKKKSGATLLPEGAILSPGFIDAQVNGGGGVMLNDTPTPETIAVMVRAHRAAGTTSLLPTLITDTREKMRTAIKAAETAIAQGQHAVLGLHLEGPFLNPARKGIHRSDHFLKPDDSDLDIMSSLQHGITLVTLAPEIAGSEFITALVKRGVIVSAGHSEASAEDMDKAFCAGITGVTHLYNAMSQLQGRAPGVVGAALAHQHCFASIIADGHHVSAEALHIALKTKTADRLFLVSDAMASLGSTQKTFSLFGKTISVIEGRLTDDNGTLAGAHLSMADAVRFLVHKAGASVADALKMATSTPAAFLSVGDTIGHIKIGYSANFTALDSECEVMDSWLRGQSLNDNKV